MIRVNTVAFFNKNNRRSDLISLLCQRSIKQPVFVMEMLDEKNDVISGSHPNQDSTSGSSHGSSPISIGDHVISVYSKEETSSRDSRLEDRKREICDQMRMRMETRRKEWNTEVEKLRRDFFHRTKTDASIAPENAKEEESKTLEPPKSPTCDKFFVSFDLSSFLPNEILVRTEDRKLIVSARHEERSCDGKRAATRTFNRQLDIPRGVNSRTMRCTLAKDGTLHLEANTTSRRSSVEIPAHPGGKTVSSNITPLLPSMASTAKSFDPRIFSITVDIGREFLPEDLAVKTVDQKLVVSARREVELPGNTSMKEFHREFDLPSTVDPTTVTASMMEGGFLLIEAPLHVVSVLASSNADS